MADANVKKLPESDDYTAEDYKNMINVCESCERWEDMCHYMKLYLKKIEYKLPGKEQVTNLSVAFKNLVSPLRTRMRSLDTQIDNLKVKEDSGPSVILQKYRDSAIQALESKCTEVTDMLGNDVIPKLEDGSSDDTRQEMLVNLYKMRGDYFRYICEHLGPSSDKRKKYVADAKKAYEDAAKHGEPLAPTDPTRLGLALNRSVFLFEIMKDNTTACKMAKQAFDEAIAKLDNLSDDDYKDSTLIMQLLRDNLTIWQQGDQVEEVED